MMKPIIYQLFPRWFTNTNENCVPNGTIKQNGVGKLNDIDHRILSSIKKLGVTHVWYTGIIEHATKTIFDGIEPCNPQIVKGEAGSPYAIRDYYDISPELATDLNNRHNEFKSLVDRTHGEGLKVIIDFVPNHVARQYKSDAKPLGVHDLGQDDDYNKFFDPNNNFYYITGERFTTPLSLGDGPNTYYEMPARATGNDCWHSSPGINDWYETIKLNYGIDPWNGNKHFSPIPRTWLLMLDIMRFWCSKGIDGLRCDMVHMVPVEFWHWAIKQIKAEFPHMIFIAEIYDTSLYRSYINYGGFDYLYDKVTLYDTLFNVLKYGESTQKLTQCWMTVNDIKTHMVNFLENHDELRLASQQFASNAIKGRPALVVSSTISTCPMMIYAGQELGETASDAEGFSGQDGRTTIFDYWSVPSIRKWLKASKLNRPNKLRDYYKRVLNLCNSEKAINEGEMFDLMYVNPHLSQQYAYIRYHNQEVILIVANFSEDDTNTLVTIPEHAFDVMGCKCGEYSAVDLLHKTLLSLELQHHKPISVAIGKWDAVMLKFNVEMN